VTVTPPPSEPATAGPCARVIGVLPLRLAGLHARRTATTPASPFVTAWGDPPIVLRCGVERPADLHPGSSAQFISAAGVGKTGPYYDVTSTSGAHVYTTVDRAVYIEISIPKTYASGPLPVLSNAISSVLPPVCKTQPALGGKPVPRRELCVYRS
jgi:hypothetical protein